MGQCRQVRPNALQGDQPSHPALAAPTAASPMGCLLLLPAEGLCPSVPGVPTSPPVCLDLNTNKYNCGACGTTCSTAGQPDCCGGSCVNKLVNRVRPVPSPPGSGPLRQQLLHRRYNLDAWEQRADLHCGSEGFLHMWLPVGR